MPPLIRPLLAALAMLLLVAGTVQAQQTLYVTDELHVTVRSGPSVENKVIAVVKSGDAVQLLKRNDDGWALVHLDDGKEGWMIERYLQENVPAALHIKKLDPQNQSLLSQVDELTAARDELKAELAQAKAKAAELEKSYAGLKKDSSGVMGLKADFERLRKEYAAQGEKNEQLTTEVESLRFGNNLKWFLAGAGVLFLGWLIGLAMGRRKRRANSSLY